jgi:DegV family protein with EDD domain
MEALMAKVAVVTDSTAYLPKDYLEKYNITVVPQVLIWGMETLEDGVDIKSEEFYRRLGAAKTLPTTSQVSIPNMNKAFSSLIEKDYDVLGIFLSSKLSGTLQSAAHGRESLPHRKEKVEIVDSLSTSMALGFQVLAAARAAQQGASLAECKSLAEEVRAHTGIYFVVDTLEFLHRGGRIGGAQRLLGTALNLKPILAVLNGKVEAVERIRTKGKAMERMIALVAEKCAGKSSSRLATLEANAQDDAQAVMRNASALIHPVETIATSVSPVVGTHTGPGTVGLAYMTDF